MYNTGSYSYTSLARIFKIKRQRVHQIVKRDRLFQELKNDRGDDSAKYEK